MRKSIKKYNHGLDIKGVEYKRIRTLCNHHYHITIEEYFLNKDKYPFFDARKRRYNFKLSRTERHTRDSLRLKYDLTLEEYKSMFEKQCGVCAICGSAETVIDKQTGKIHTLCVDHCHKTGKVRGLLCHKCNSLLGYANDNVNILQKAQEYLMVG